MIVTTNKPEQLDAAFIRPGRIDMKIEFKKCTDKIIKEILYLYFKERTDITFKNYKYSQAEVFEKCFNLNNFDEVVRELLK
jgi:ATP-dependent 26S proteasome regulatory subunit